MARLLEPLLAAGSGHVKVNLLPYNDTGVAPLAPASDESVQRFRDVIMRAG
jgi:hypothetical protein